MLRVMGEGGFATVWRARDLREDREVAVKVLHEFHAADPMRRERFLRGARKMRELSHPAIARVLDTSPEGARATYIVMDPFDGDLRALAASGLVKADLALRVALRIADALAYMHEREIVHRDVKPSNILVRGNDEPVLTDFDLVGFKDTTGGTRTGALGTFVYAAPEMMTRPQEASPAADVFGLSMTTIFLLYGAMLPMDVLRDGPTFVDALDVHSSIKIVLKRAIDWNPERRPQDGRAFFAALSEAMERRTRGAGAGPRKERHVLLWSAGEQIPSETRWVCISRDSPPRVFGKRRGLSVAAAGRIWEWQSSLRPIRLVEQSAFNEDASEADLQISADAPRLQSSISEGHIVDLLSGLRVPVMSERPVPFEDTRQFELRRAIIPVGAIGHRVFVFEWNLEHNNGFWHHRATAFFRVVDLQRVAIIEPLDKLSRSTIVDEIELSALAQLDGAFAYDDPGVDEALRPQLTVYRPRWRDDGKMCLACQITAMCAFTESDNRWHSYTKSVSVLLPDVPPSFSEVMDVPAEVIAIWPGASAGEAYMGASYVDDDEVILSLETYFNAESD
ncbi:hypothetical protein BE17_51340 [Sorangium cellulosum]|uniref:Protein kinase domain-containing protein n=1 Tax=Sorangium cellulosum TaxID=56 RepID=A0A150S891_SORCE|nr:hypothetical protein BE17_51340 [Sorangium cellulosum]